MVSLALLSGPAHAAEIAVGLAGLEEGDDRLRPAASLHVGFSPFYYARAAVWGRTFGPVTERSVMLNFARRFGVLKSNVLAAGIGATILQESTIISYDSADDQAFNDEEHRYNFGAHFSLSGSIPKSPLYMGFGWDGNVFLAGSGGLFLASGRKQMLSLYMGTRF